MPTEHRSRQTARVHHRLPTRSARRTGATATSGGGRPASCVESEGGAGRPSIHSLPPGQYLTEKWPVLGRRLLAGAALIVLAIQNVVAHVWKFGSSAR